MDYESELFGFPLTSEDDQVDSTSQALELDVHPQRPL